MRYLERTHGVSVAWLHEIFQADHIALVYEITGKMTADIHTKGYDDARKWKSVTSLINIVTSEFLRSPQTLELSRTTNDLSCKRLPSHFGGGYSVFYSYSNPHSSPQALRLHSPKEERQVRASRVSWARAGIGRSVCGNRRRAVRWARGFGLGELYHPVSSVEELGLNDTLCLGHADLHLASANLVQGRLRFLQVRLR